MRPEARLLVWLLVGGVLSTVTASRLLDPLALWGGEDGLFFQALTYSALIALIFSFEWRRLKAVLAEEGPLRSHPLTRGAGACLIAALVVLAPLSNGAVETSELALILTLFAAALVVNPLTARFLLPFAVILLAGIGAPYYVATYLGGPFAYVTAAVTAGFVYVLGLPASWQGTQFLFMGKGGGFIQLTVASTCSSLYSVAAFLGLIAFLHVEFRKDTRSTVTLALAGVAALVLLDSARIAVMVWLGHVDGFAALSEAHNWLGYLLFLGVDLAALFAYPRMGRGRGLGGQAAAPV